MLSSFKAFNVNIRLRRKKSCDLRARVNHWNHVVLDRVVKFLGEIIDAQRILESKIESVRCVEHFVAFCWTVWTRKISAIPVNINIGEFLKISNQLRKEKIKRMLSKALTLNVFDLNLISPGERVAMRDKPSSHLMFLLDHFQNFAICNDFVICCIKNNKISFTTSLTEKVVIGLFPFNVEGRSDL